MRIKTLQLLKYGKFTDAHVVLPKAPQDFHFIVGPNEAGKSTIRQAIGELLFGINPRSPLGFLHAQSELRLGATLQGASTELEFHRTKATKSPLRTPDDAKLPESALAPFLGGADRSFFLQMFGLGHQELIRGGQSILDASSDLGQVLFQSSAGIARLGLIRDRLSEEAASLWSPRKANDRAYYIGQNMLDAATEQLKESVVRTKSWSEAHAAVTDAEDKLAAEQGRHRTLEAQRSGLERIRRLAPVHAALCAAQVECEALGAVLEFPGDSATVCSSAQAGLASAEAIQELRDTEVQRLTTALSAIVVDRPALTVRRDIEALDATRQVCRNHPRDILRRQDEVDSLVTEATGAAAELSWPTEEAALRAMMPNALALKAVTKLVRDRGALAVAATTGASAVRDKEDEVAALVAELASIPELAVSPELRSALEVAQSLRDTEAKQQRLAVAVGRAEAALERKLQALGAWRQGVDALRSMTPPTAARVARLISDRQSLALLGASASEQRDAAHERVGATKREIEACTQDRHLVTPAEVKNARAGRDTAWRAIKGAEVSLAIGAPVLDAALARADELVDAQLGSVTGSTELHSLQQRLAREEDESAHRLQVAQGKERDLAAFDQAWADLSKACGLQGMHLEDVTAWLAHRAEALLAEEAHLQAQGERAAEQEAARAASRRLADMLLAGGLMVEPQAGIGHLCGFAAAHISDAERAAARRSALAKQLTSARAALLGLGRANAAAGDALAAWKAQWAAALAQARLTGDTGTDSHAEAAVDIVMAIQDKLEKAREVRRARIDTMRADLDAFAQDTRRIAAELDANLLGHNADEISAELSRRLAAALTAQADAERIKRELQRAQTEARQALEAVQSVHATLQPLLERALVRTPQELEPLIARSDRARVLADAIARARLALVSGGDGLALEALFEELVRADVPAAQAALSAVMTELQESVDAQSMLSTELAAARQRLATISGSANAAIAEAKRQEALAQMADASERYVKVATAARLLRWAIDRYRDRKQGPMLARASAIFAQLTLGGFHKLTVDYDKQPLALSALRSGGTAVEIPGMSEGTRDQLYLALRLAALELHLEQTDALPFIADDLFVNFDNARAKAGLQALADLSQRTQVIFLSHHEHLVPMVREVFGSGVNVVTLH